MTDLVDANVLSEATRPQPDTGVLDSLGRLVGPTEKTSGRSMPVKDSLIAAPALQHGLTVVTRNTSDFQHAGVPLIDPFSNS